MQALTYRIPFRNEYSVSNCCKNRILGLCALPCTSLSRQAESALVRSLEKVVTWECKTQVWKLRKAAETQLPVLPDTANLLQSWTAPKQPFI